MFGPSLGDVDRVDTCQQGFNPPWVQTLSLLFKLKPIQYSPSKDFTSFNHFMDIFDRLEEFLEENPELNPRTHRSTSSTKSGDQNADKKPLIVILGPTASGKTALSIKIAKAFNGEIISTDSRQIYKYMDIGTDKIPVQKQEGVTHHLLDIIEPDQEFTLADFKRAALKTIEEIYRRRKLPILVGGTGLYLNAILQNYQIPQVPPQQDLRQKLEDYSKEHGSEALHQLLAEKDSQAADSIHPNNVRYVIRALEINMVANAPKMDQKGESIFHAFIIGINWPREFLYERINRRVDDQIARGLLNEVKTLLMKGYDEKLPAMSSLGYLELIQYTKGECTLEQAIENIKKNTRNYAKRQLTWFRHYQNVHWVEGEELEKLLSQQRV